MRVSSLRSMPPRSMLSDFFWTATITILAPHLAEAMVASKTAGGAGGVEVDVGADSEGGLQALGDDVGHGHVLDPPQLQPDRGAQADRPGAEDDDLVGGFGLGAVDAVAGDGHRLVEGGDVEGDGVREDGDALADDGVLDEQVLAHAAKLAATADDSGGGGLRVDDHAVADL